MLTQNQISFYQENGFLILEKLIDDAQCDRLKERIEFLIAKAYQNDPISIFDTAPKTHIDDDYFLNSGDKIRFFFEKKAFDEEQVQKPLHMRLNKIGHALHDLDPVFDRFSRQEKIKALIFDLGFLDPLLAQSMYIFKQPLIGGEVVPHQDGTFLITNPDTLVGLWFAIEDSTKENGCLWAIPKEHRGPLKTSFVRKDNRLQFIQHDQTPWNLENMIPLEAKKGSVIVLHSHLPHMSFENHSKQSRHAYTLHCIEKNSEYATNNWLQREPNMPFRGFVS